MITYFPRISEDELMYSMISRYAYNLHKNESVKQTYRELFGDSNVVLSIDLVSRIDYLVKQTAKNPYITADLMIMEHTLYPLYYPFLDNRRQKDIYTHMKGNEGNTIHMEIGIMASKVHCIRTLRYCPQCVKEDIERYGEAYWHRIHNLPGMFVCCKHGVPLSEKCSKSGELLYKKDSRELVCVQKLIDDGYELTGKISMLPKRITVNSKERLLEIARSLNYLMTSELYKENIDCNSVFKVYRRKLEQSNLCYSSGRIKGEQLKMNLKEFYGEQVLEILGLDFEVDQEYSWIKSFLEKKIYS